MASETTIENVMLSGQTAYFKKTGSMINRGTLDLPNALVARNYAEGYVGPDSVLHGTDLATTSDYLSAESLLQNYLEEDWTEVQNERTLITNSNVITTALTPYYTSIQNLADSTGLGGNVHLEYVRSTGAQYVDTGIIPDANTKVEVTLSNVDTGVEGTIFGHDWSPTGFVLCGFETRLAWHYGNTDDTIANNNITVKHTVSVYRRQIYLDGTRILNNTTSNGKKYTKVKSTEGRYFKLYKVDNVIVYGTSQDKKDKKEINSILKDLGY